MFCGAFDCHSRRCNLLPLRFDITMASSLFNYLMNRAGFTSTYPPPELPKPLVTICLIDGPDNSDNKDFAERIVRKLNVVSHRMCIRMSYENLAKSQGSESQNQDMIDAIEAERDRMYKILALHADPRKLSPSFCGSLSATIDRLMVVIHDWSRMDQLAALSKHFDPKNIWSVRIALPRFIEAGTDARPIEPDHVVFGHCGLKLSDTYYGGDLQLTCSRLEMTNDRCRWMLSESDVFPHVKKPDIGLGLQITMAYDSCAATIADKFTSFYGGCSSSC